jgi:hypothetical protein
MEARKEIEVTTVHREPFVAVLPSWALPFVKGRDSPERTQILFGEVIGNPKQV